MTTSRDIDVNIEGLDELLATLQELPRKLRRRALHNALAAGARIVRDAARQIRSSAPVTGKQFNNPYRKPGTVAKRISVRTSKQATAAGDVGVFVNVKPLPGSQQSAHNPDDPFYWRWLEFGAPGHHVAARPFLAPAAAKLSDALSEFERVIGPQIQRLDTDPKDPL